MVQRHWEQRITAWDCQQRAQGYAQHNKDPKQAITALTAPHLSPVSLGVKGSSCAPRPCTAGACIPPQRRLRNIRGWRVCYVAHRGRAVCLLWQAPECAFAGLAIRLRSCASMLLHAPGTCKHHVKQLSKLGLQRFCKQLLDRSCQLL